MGVVKEAVKEGQRILALNGGSSSLKFALYEWRSATLSLLVQGEAQGVGASNGAAGQLSIKDSKGRQTYSAEQTFADVRAAAEMVFTQIEPQLTSLAAIAHRIVHGGPELLEHQRLTPEVRMKLEAAKDFAPLHMPPALAVIDSAVTRFTGTAQIICLDTAFHRTLPERAQRFPLPDDVIAGGVRRYGAHGLSLESAVNVLGADLKPRCVIAHLGGGCSVTAVKRGRSADTTMGLTPTGGMMMGTRTGDLDPGLLIYLLRHRGFTADTLEELVDRRAGLLGVSGSSADLRSLVERAHDRDAKAELALEMFSYEAAQAIAKMTVALGGLDQLIFTGGIGEHAVEIRGSIAARLGFLGVLLNGEANTAGTVHPGVISGSGSGAEVRVVPAQEELRMGEIAVELCE